MRKFSIYDNKTRKFKALHRTQESKQITHGTGENFAIHQSDKEHKEYKEFLKQNK